MIHECSVILGIHTVECLRSGMVGAHGSILTATNSKLTLQLGRAMEDLGSSGTTISPDF